MALRVHALQQRALESDLRLTALGLESIVAASSSSSSSSSAAASSGVGVQSSFAALAQLARVHQAHAERNLQGLRAVLSTTQLARFFDLALRYGAVCIQINV